MNKVYRQNPEIDRRGVNRIDQWGKEDMSERKGREVEVNGRSRRSGEKLTTGMEEKEEKEGEEEEDRTR